jgi:enoyl-CoA hydratase/carnithine racemase
MFDLSIAEGVARLALNRPAARNAIPADQWPRLGAAAAEAEEKGARLLLVSGEGDAFCAGADLADLALLADNEAARAGFRAAMRAALDRIRDLPIPVVAVIDGPCFGAGVALAMACDIRLAGPSSRFSIPPAQLGISYPQEDVRRLVGLVGAGQAARLLLGTGAIWGHEAERIGLVEMFVPAGLHQAVAELTGAILAGSADSLRLLKRSIRAAEGEVAGDAEQDRAFEARFGSDDFANRLAALRPKAGGQ